jgi:hypothetical protein
MVPTLVVIELDGSKEIEAAITREYGRNRCARHAEPIVTSATDCDFQRARAGTSPRLTHPGRPSIAQ